MNWFFIQDFDRRALLTGEDALHIKKSLRMSVGEILTVCDKTGTQHLCGIDRICDEGVWVRELSREESQNEPSVEISLFASLTKGDKFESMVQKSVELGVHCIVPILTDRCISRPDGKAWAKKHDRYQKIASQAAMQSHRNIIPEVEPILTLRQASQRLKNFDKSILFYEGGGRPVAEILSGSEKRIAVFIGPEGGFGESEVELLVQSGAVRSTLGRRILRAETAPVAALSILMFMTGNME